jgi:hypothetical protein
VESAELTPRLWAIAAKTAASAAQRNRRGMTRFLSDWIGRTQSSAAARDLPSGRLKTT